MGIAAGIAGPGHYALTILTGLTEGGVYVATYVSESALKNESLVTDGKGIGEPYSWVYHRTVEEAVNWLIANIDTASIKD